MSSGGRFNRRRTPVTISRIKAAEFFSVAYGEEGSYGERSVNQMKIAALAEDFKAAPSAKTAAEIAQHAVLHELAKVISGHFAGIAADLRREVSTELEPVAKALTDRVVAELDRQLEAGIGALEKVDGMTDAISGLRTKHARALEVARHDCAETVARHEVLPWVANNFGSA